MERKSKKERWVKRDKKKTRLEKKKYEWIKKAKSSKG